MKPNRFEDGEQVTHKAVYSALGRNVHAHLAHTRKAATTVSASAELHKPPCAVMNRNAALPEKNPGDQKQRKRAEDEHEQDEQYQAADIRGTILIPMIRLRGAATPRTKICRRRVGFQAVRAYFRVHTVL